MRRSTFTTASTAHPVRGTYGPLLKDPKGISLVLPDLSKTEWLPQPKETDQTSVLAHIRDNRLLDFNDSVALARLTGMLGQWNKPYSVLLSSDATFEDLQRGPTILIGAVDNPWTMRFLQTLPYSVARRGTSMTFEIVGKQAGSPSAWSVDTTEPFEKVQQDFGILVRQTDTMTGRPVLIIAGLGQNGTTAGIRLRSDTALTRQITAGARRAGQAATSRSSSAPRLSTTSSGRQSSWLASTGKSGMPKKRCTRFALDHGNNT